MAEECHATSAQMYASKERASLGERTVQVAVRRPHSETGLRLPEPGVMFLTSKGALLWGNLFSLVAIPEGIDPAGYAGL